MANGSAPTERAVGSNRSPVESARRLVLSALGVLGASAVLTQLTLLREMLAVFHGNEMVLGLVLGNWFLLTGAGALLGRWAGRRRAPTGTFLAAQVVVALAPLGQVLGLRTLRDLLFLRGALVGLVETAAASFGLLLPFCLASGFMLTAGCALLATPDRSTSVGRVYVADSLGSVGGGLLFSLVLVRYFDHVALLFLPAVLNLLLAGALAQRLGWAGWRGAVGLLLLGLGVLAWRGDLDARSTARQFPGQQVVFKTHSPYGRLVVTESAGQLSFYENGQLATSSQDDQQVEETVHYALAQRPQAGRVLLLGGGISGTAKEALKYGVREVAYVELDPAMIELGRRFLSDRLNDPRIQAVSTDGRRFVRQTSDRFDVVVVDLPDPMTAQLNRYYTAEFYQELKRVLAPAGVVSFSLGHYENYVSPALARLLAAAARTAQTAFAQVRVLPGSRVRFLASDGVLDPDIAACVERAGVPTRWMRREALGPVLSADRLADLQRAVAQPAAVNRDSSPVLYFYHLLHWSGQFDTRVGWVGAVLAGALGISLWRLRAAAWAIGASGFAASGLQFMLLLGYQTLCGSLYQQVGLLVTLCMAGLAIGAAISQRMTFAQPRHALAGLAAAIALGACLVPGALRGLGQVPATSASPFLVPLGVGATTLALALLVGAEFPLAARLDTRAAATIASTLYLADFIGACLGAMLTSALLVPRFGMVPACGVIALLNLAGAIPLLVGKTRP